MTDNLGAGRIGSALASGQWAKADDMAGALDAALTEGPLSLSFVAGSPANTVTLTAAQFIGNVAFQAVAGSPGPSGACTLNVPATNAQATTLKRGFFAVINDLGLDLTVQKSGGQSETPPTLNSGQRSILYFDGSNVYLAVPQGSVGSDGVSAGIRWNFDTSTTTTADPGSGDVRLNNAALASVTEIALSDNSGESGNPSVEAWLATWDDSTSSTKGYVLLEKAGAPENFATYAVTAAVNEAGWWRFTVTHVASSGSFSATDALAVQFFPKGDQGAGSTVAVSNSGQSPNLINAAADTLHFSDEFVVTDAGGGQVDVALAAGAGGGAFSGALVKRSVDQTAANYGTFTSIPWDAEVYDTDGLHDNVTNNTRLTVPSGWAKARVTAGVYVSSSSVQGAIRILKNGAEFDGIPHQFMPVVSTVVVGNVVTAAVDVTAGDYFECQLQTSGDTSITVLGGNRSWFAIEKVS